MTSTKQLAIRGTIWTIGTYGLSQILRFGSNLLLTRLLAPDLFGLMSLVMVFIVGLHLFSDIGIRPSIIQNKRGDDPKFLNTAWTIQIVRSLALWLCCIAIAWPVSYFYKEPRLLWLIPVVGLGTVIAGFESTAIPTLNRHMDIRQISIFEMANQVISIVVLLVWAWLSPSVWALVAGGLTANVVSLIWSHRINTKQPNRLEWEPEAAKEIFSYGKWIFISTAVTFLSEQLDKLLLPMLASFGALGVYNIAFALADIPRQILLAVSSKVFFSAFSRLKDLPREEFRAKILKNRLPLLLAAAVGLAVMVGFGDLAVRVLYDKRYADAAWMLPLMALGIWPRVLTQTIDQALFAIGQPRYVSYGCFLKFLFMAIALPAGFHVAGLAGAVTVVALNDLPYYGAIWYGLQQERLSTLIQDIQVTLVFGVLVGVLVAGRLALGFGSPLHGLVG